MKHIVFIVGEFYPNVSANGYCVKKIIEDLKRKFKISVICYNTDNSIPRIEEDGVDVYLLANLRNKLRNRATINMNRTKSKVIKAVSKSILYSTRIMRAFISSYSWPTSEKWFINKAYQQLTKINEVSKIDAIITVSLPYETHICGLKFKTNNKNVKWITYTLDEFTENDALHRFEMNRSKKKEINLVSEREVYNLADFNFITEPAKEWFGSTLNVPKNKFQVISFPLMATLTPSNKEIIQKEKNKIHILYAGTFYRKIRNPEYLLKLFTETNNNNQFVLHLFTKGDCEHIISKYQKLSNGNIRSYGVAPIEDVHRAMLQADILVNVGNTVPTQLPSKIYELISSGKPVINLFYHNLSYKDFFNHYPLVLHVNQSDTLFDENKTRFNDFCLENKDKLIAYNEVEKLYNDSTPGYIAGLFENHINK